MKYPQRQSGFTAIELLITLFVAAGFLVAGYQLFNVIIKDGGQARAESRAGNIAYDYLRRHTSLATDPCTTQTPLNNSPLSVDGLSNVNVTISITCPEYSTTSLSKVEVTLTYNTPQQTVKYSTLSNGSGTQTTDITDGLAGWWKFNGNANTSVGTANGTPVNVTSAVGQGGLPDTAYSFNGTSSYISFGNLPIFNSQNLTMSAWVRPTTLSGTQTILAKELSYKYRLPGSAANAVLYGAAGAGWTYTASYAAPAITTSSWSHVVMVIDGATSTIYGYVNGVQVGTGAITAATAYSSASLTAGSYTTPPAEVFNGRIDDLRFYSRALSPDEVATLYSGGAK